MSQSLDKNLGPGLTDAGVVCGEEILVVVLTFTLSHSLSSLHPPFIFSSV